MPRGTWMPLPRPFGLAPLVIVLQQAEYGAVVVPVVEEDGVADAAFLSEAHLPSEGQAPLVLRVGPPTDAVEVQLFERLPQQEADDLRAEPLRPVGFLRDCQADVARRRPPRPLVDADPAPADWLAARLLLDDVVPVRETLSLDGLVVPRDDGLQGDRVVGERSREAHQLLVILPFVEQLHIVPLERPERHQLAGQHAEASLLRLRLVDRDRIDAHAQSRKFQAEPDGRSSRRLLREEFSVRLVHGRKVPGIREEDRRPDDRTEAEVQLLEDRPDVPQGLARLPSDVRGSPFTPLRSAPQRL